MNGFSAAHSACAQFFGPPPNIPGIFFAYSPDLPMNGTCVQLHGKRKAESTVCSRVTHPLFASGNIAVDFFFFF